MKTFIHSIILLLCLFSLLISKTEQIKLEHFNNISYISLNALSNKLELKTKFYSDNNNVEVTINKKKLIFSNGSSYCKINNTLYHLYSPVLYNNNDFLIPANALVDLFKSKNITDNININSSHNLLLIMYDDFNIINYAVHKKTNGFVIELITTHTFDDKLIPIWKSDNNWISINVPNGVVDIEVIKNISPPHPIDELKIEQMDKSVQISFLLTIISDQEEVASDDKKILITLYTSQRENAEKIRMEKKKFIIDKIVLDAGHGGKDPGACSARCKIKEKDITLDITKKVGKQLQNKYGLEVIYTRTDDRFISLNNRQDTANNSAGDMFISIHVNSIENSTRTKGFEVYFLSHDKLQEAISQIEERENSVIKYESNTDYERMDQVGVSVLGEVFHKQSERLAINISDELSKKLNKKLNRGVKQARFQVLWKVQMPKVLVEVGFITNKEESNNLIDGQYQQQIADAIVQAIINYKTYYDKQLLQ